MLLTSRRYAHATKKLRLRKSPIPRSAVAPIGSKKNGKAKSEGKEQDAENATSDISVLCVLSRGSLKHGGTLNKSQLNLQLLAANA